MRHLFWNEGHSISGIEFLLLDLNEGFDCEGLCSFFGVLVIEPIDEGVEIGANLFAEFDFLFYLPAGSGVVFGVEIEVGVHEQLDCFYNVNVVVFLVLDQLVALDSDIYFGQGLTVAVVEIAELDPFVHETQGDLVVILFVLGDLVVVVNSSGFVHLYTR